MQHPGRQKKPQTTKIERLILVLSWMWTGLKHQTCPNAKQGEKKKRKEKITKTKGFK